MWLDEGRHDGWAGRARYNYEQLWRHLPEEFTVLACDDVNRDDIKKVLDYDDYTADKAQRIGKMLKKCFKDGFVDEWFTSSPSLTAASAQRSMGSRLGLSGGLMTGLSN